MYSCFLKRVIDFIIAFCVLAAIFPILLLLIIFLHFANKGAGVFFTQNRPGKNAKIFKAIKFKTMTDERDSEGNLLSDAERLTKVGKNSTLAFNRRTATVAKCLERRYGSCWSKTIAS